MKLFLKTNRFEEGVSNSIDQNENNDHENEVNEESESGLVRSTSKTNKKKDIVSYLFLIIKIIKVKY
jgi:hypothetical protein